MSWKQITTLCAAFLLASGLAVTGCKKPADNPPADVDTDTPELDVTTGEKVDSPEEAREAAKANSGTSEAKKEGDAKKDESKKAEEPKVEKPKPEKKDNAEKKDAGDKKEGEKKEEAAKKNG